MPVTWDDAAIPSASSDAPWDEAAVRRRTVKQLAGSQKVENTGCSPSVFLTLTGLLLCAVLLTVGIFLFNVQWRRYGALGGGHLEWQCTLIACQLRYTYLGGHPMPDVKNLLLKRAKKLFSGKLGDAALVWIQDFTKGKPEHFPPLMDLQLCREKSIQNLLFKGFCESSSRFNKLIGGTIWSLIKRASRLGLALVVVCILLSIFILVFVAVDHQIFKKEKKPRWAVAEVKTGKLRPFAKVAAGLLPICTSSAVLQYRLGIQSLESAGGVCKQNTLAFLVYESGEVQLPWGALWYSVIACVQLAVSIGLLRGPLRKPVVPLAMDLVEIQLEHRRTLHEERKTLYEEQRKTLNEEQRKTLHQEQRRTQHEQVPSPRLPTRPSVPPSAPLAPWPSRPWTPHKGLGKGGKGPTSSRPGQAMYPPPPASWGGPRAF